MHIVIAPRLLSPFVYYRLGTAKNTSHGLNFLFISVSYQVGGIITERVGLVRLTNLSKVTKLMDTVPLIALEMRAM